MTFSIIHLSFNWKYVSNFPFGSPLFPMWKCWFTTSIIRKKWNLQELELVYFSRAPQKPIWAEVKLPWNNILNFFWNYPTLTQKNHFNSSFENDMPCIVVLCIWIICISIIIESIPQTRQLKTILERGFYLYDFILDILYLLAN